jgi:hypothetical protein
VYWNLQRCAYAAVHFLFLFHSDRPTNGAYRRFELLVVLWAPLVIVQAHILIKCEPHYVETDE